MLDTCTRLTQVNRVGNRTTLALLQGIDEVWVRPYGPPRVIETDQAGGLINEQAEHYLSQLGVEMK